MLSRTHVINKYQQKDSNQTPIGETAPIWVCWWQGEKQMPELVKQCYKLLKKYSGTHPVKLLTKNNYQE